jgi:diacylglycerol kinase (ATP)
VLAMDMGRVAGRHYLEAAGAGLDASLFVYMSRLDKDSSPRGFIRGTMRLLRSVGTPRLIVDSEGQSFELRAPMIVAANCPFFGAAIAIAPEARIDDGLLDVVAFPEASPRRVLMHLAAVSGGRQVPGPATVRRLRVRRLALKVRTSHPLPLHADGSPVGRTPARFEVVPAALNVLVGKPDPDATCAWDPGISSS